MFCREICKSSAKKTTSDVILLNRLTGFMLCNKNFQGQIDKEQKIHTLHFETFNDLNKSLTPVPAVRTQLHKPLISFTGTNHA